MSTLTKTISLAAVALCAFPIVALSVARAQPVTVQVSDLDFSRPAHVATFDGRVERAADKFCEGYADTKNLSAIAACKDGIRSEADEKSARLWAISLASR